MIPIGLYRGAAFYSGAGKKHDQLFHAQLDEFQLMVAIEEDEAENLVEDLAGAVQVPF